MFRTFPAALLAVPSLFAQARPAPAFEVAVIKPSTDPYGSTSGIITTTGRIHAINVTLKRCVRGAYGVEEAAIMGGPKWFDQDRYYIDATAPGPAGDGELMIMLRSLLAERFRLELHREHRDLAGYALVVAKGGLKAAPSSPDGSHTGDARRGSIDSHRTAMPDLANKLSEVLHVPVVDTTAILGEFDIHLRWTDEDQGQSTSAYPSIFSAVQEQLGLRLESRKVAAEIIVIDGAEKPSEN